MLYCLRFQTLVYVQANLLETLLETSSFIMRPNGFAKQVFWKCVYCLGCITLYPGRNKKVTALPNQDIKLYYFFDRSKRYSIIAYEVFRAGIQNFNSRRIKKTPKFVFETQCFEGLFSTFYLISKRPLKSTFVKTQMCRNHKMITFYTCVLKTISHIWDFHVW